MIKFLAIEERYFEQFDGIESYRTIEECQEQELLYKMLNGGMRLYTLDEYPDVQFYFGYNELGEKFAPILYNIINGFDLKKLPPDLECIDLGLAFKLKCRAHGINVKL